MPDPPRLGRPRAPSRLRRSGAQLRRPRRHRWLLPWAEPTEDDLEADSGIGATPRGRGEHILVVEDEESVRRFVSSALERLGYRLEPELIHRDNLVVLS